MELRPYQKECVRTVNEKPDGSRTIVCLATGLGKTATAANLEVKGRLLWLSHRDELVRQPEKYFKELGKSYGIEKAKETSNGEDVVSASVQTLVRDKRLTKFRPDEFDVIVCDEAQHAAAPTYRKILGYFKPRKLVGLTATPKRGDGLRLTDSFDDICFVRDLKWGIENGYLSRLRCVRVSSDYDMNKVDKVLGDFTASGLGDEMEDSDDDVVIAKAYLDYCVPEKRRTLVYCPTIKNCEKVAETIRTVLPEDEKDTVRVLSDGTSPTERAEILSKYSAGEVRCVVNCMILTEGADLPETSCVINNRPTANDSLYAQIVGRGTRLAEGKEYCLVVDVVGKNSERKNLCVAPTLFGLNPDELPESTRKEMENEDLLEFSEAIRKRSAETVKNAVLIRQLVDAFTQERIEIAREAAPEGYRGIATVYRKRISETKPEDPDFGDVLARRTPYDERRYRIDASYEGRMYVSVPDVAGMVVVEARIPEAKVGGKPIEFKSDPMKVEDATTMISEILEYVVPEKFRMKWSKSERESLSKVPATKKQKERLAFDYSKFSVSDDLSELSMTEASDLISLRNEMDEFERYGAEPDAAETPDDESERKRRKAWKKFEKALSDMVGKKKAQETKTKKEEKKLAGKIIGFSVEVDYSYYYNANRPVSSRQKSYVESLLSEAERRGFELDAKPNLEKDGLDAWQASVAIECLKKITKDLPVPKSRKAEVKFEDFLEELEDLDPESPENEIRCSYRLLSDDEMSELEDDERNEEKEDEDDFL